MDLGVMNMYRKREGKLELLKAPPALGLPKRTVLQGPIQHVLLYLSKLSKVPSSPIFQSTAHLSQAT